MSGMAHGRVPIVSLVWLAAVGCSVLAVVMPGRGGSLAAFVAALAVVGTIDLVQTSPHHPAGLPIIGHARFLAEPSPARRSGALHLSRTPRRAVRPGHPRHGLHGGPGLEGRGAVRHRTRRPTPSATSSSGTRCGPIRPPTCPPRCAWADRTACSHDIALLNVSAMSLALSANAIEALNGGAAGAGSPRHRRGRDQPYHLKHGGDLIWGDRLGLLRVPDRQRPAAAKFEEGRAASVRPFRSAVPGRQARPRRAARAPKVSAGSPPPAAFR